MISLPDLLGEPSDSNVSVQADHLGRASSQDDHFSQLLPQLTPVESSTEQESASRSISASALGQRVKQWPSVAQGADNRSDHQSVIRPYRNSVLRTSQRTGSNVSVATIRGADVFYKRRAPIIQNPLVPPRPCRELLRHLRRPGNNLSIVPGPARHRLAEERRHFYQYKSACPNGPCNLNPAVATPMTARPNPHTSAIFKSAKRNQRLTWAELEERLKDYRDHLLAEEIGYETLVGNLLYIDIPGGRDINRSWQNFLSEDIMEWGFPYYKGSRERPRVNSREPYLAHQLKEKLWRYPKTRIFHSTAED